MHTSVYTYSNFQVDLKKFSHKHALTLSLHFEGVAHQSSYCREPACLPIALPCMHHIGGVLYKNIYITTKNELLHFLCYLSCKYVEVIVITVSMVQIRQLLFIPYLCLIFMSSTLFDTPHIGIWYSQLR